MIVSPINAKFCPVSVLVNSGNENVIWEDHVDKPFKKLSATELHRIRQRYGCLFIIVSFLVHICYWDKSCYYGYNIYIYRKILKAAFWLLYTSHYWKELFKLLDSCVDNAALHHAAECSNCPQVLYGLEQ